MKPQLKTWLIEHGIPRDKIFIECISKDTVGNGVYSVKIMKDLKIENVTIISSASHMRRALSIFTEEAIIEGVSINFGNLVYLDYPLKLKIIPQIIPKNVVSR